MSDAAVEDESDPLRDGEWTSPREVTRKPALLSGTLALVAATLVVVLGALFSLPSVAAGLLGLASLGGALTYGRRWMADLGGASLLAGTILVGFSRVEPAALACAVGTVVAWDLTNHAVGVGEQLGREADTTWAELFHAGGTIAAGVVTAGVAYVVYQTATGGQPVAAVFFMLLAALALISSLRL